MLGSAWVTNVTTRKAIKLRWEFGSPIRRSRR